MSTRAYWNNRHLWVLLREHSKDLVGECLPDCLNAIEILIHVDERRPCFVELHARDHPLHLMSTRAYWNNRHLWVLLREHSKDLVGECLPDCLNAIEIQDHFFELIYSRK